MASSGSATEQGVRIRMYRVGFGDFFLVSVPEADGTLAHILVDCGVHAHDLGVIDDAVLQLQKDTGGKLALIIMTHRHADHISGFGSARATFEAFRVERVWMSWFENRSDPNAAKIQAGLAATALHLHVALAARARPNDNQYSNMAGNILGVAKGGGNAGALAMLHSFTAPDGSPTPVDYYAAGEAPTLPASLAGAGLQAEILGPPRDTVILAKMDNAAHQYLTSEAAEDDGSKPPFAKAYQTERFAWTAEGAPFLGLDVIEARIRDNQPDALALAAQKADNALNNQSLVVLFTFRGKTMLFSGDAQWGNWANFLFGGPIGTPGHTALTAQSKTILGNLDFYKVGHHGSTNATPIDVVNAMKQGCVAMCSTDPGAYGNPDKGTEVPRVPLMAALEQRTQMKLARSDQVAARDKDGKEVKAASSSLPALAKPFEAGDKGYVDYWLEAPAGAGEPA